MCPHTTQSAHQNNDDGSHQLAPSSKQLLSFAREYGLSLEESQADRIIQHLMLMLTKNQRINLTSIRDPERALVLHALDSLLFLLPLQQLTGTDDKKMQILDMGTGGGFPGIPLACVLPGQMTLLDSAGKKIMACREFVEKLGLTHKVSLVSARLEEFAGTTHGYHQFDVIVARALAPLDVLIEYATPLLAHHGHLILSKGKLDCHERDHAELTSRLCGLACVSRETIHLPESYGQRELLMYEQSSESLVRLPRKNGEARKHPLAQRH